MSKTADETATLLLLEQMEKGGILDEVLRRIKENKTVSAAHLLRYALHLPLEMAHKAVKMIQEFYL